MYLLVILYIYFVSFLDKPEKSAPALSPRAIEQRAKWHIPTDEMDYPVCAAYLDSLRARDIKIHHTSRWFNGATVEMDVAKVAEVESLSFVTAVELTRDESGSLYSQRKRAISIQHSAIDHHQSSIIVRYTDQQLALYNLTPLHDLGYEGQGILMTVCDGGFTNANTMECFRQTQELGHFDFTDDIDDFYGNTGDHGSECLSAISGIQDGYYGAATKADYYLMRSEEYATESPKEMDNLVAALEKADSLGVNVFSFSGGYAQFDNPIWDLNKWNDLDGKTTRVSRAATIAARKGMLVCAAAGNDGDVAWRTISAPCDADSILTVGAVRTDSVAADFSSYGPSSDGRIKPEVCAVGVQSVLINPFSNAIVRSNGTSFATPLLAGMAASLWSALPDKTAMQIRDLIIQSAHLYPSYDPNNQMGYGIPDAWQAYTMGLGEDTDNLTPAIAPEEGVKMLIDGQIYILRGGKRYDLLGKELGH